MKTYLRFPDEMVLITEQHRVKGTSEFTLIMRGTIRDYAEAGGKVFWLLEPSFEQMSDDDLVIKLLNDGS